MKESKKNNNNQVHLFGHINNVRMNGLDDGRTAVNLDVVTRESYKDSKGEVQTKRTYHDVAIFTDDKKLIKSFQKIGKDCDKNVENRDVEGYKPIPHSISLDGIMVNKTSRLGDTDKTYQSVQILAGVDSIDLDAKQEEKELRNKAYLVGNIGSVRLVEDKKFAVVSLMHHYRPEGSEKEYTTNLDVRINGDRSVGKETYEKLVKGEMGVGDFIRVGGQLHNNRFETEDGVRYGVSLDATSAEVLKSRQAEAKTAKVEVKEEKASTKKSTKKATEKKETAKKKATPRKKGVTM